MPGKVRKRRGTTVEVGERISMANASACWGKGYVASGATGREVDTLYEKKNTKSK